jgi:hypothetical protein
VAHCSCVGYFVRCYFSLNLKNLERNTPNYFYHSRSSFLFDVIDFEYDRRPWVAKNIYKHASVKSRIIFCIITRNVSDHISLNTHEEIK